MSTICTRCDESASTCVCVEPRLLEVGKANTYASLPFFTPSPAPIPPAAYHNVFPPVTPEGIQEAAKRLQELRAQWDKEDAEIFASVLMPERLPPRVPDLCPDDMGFARVDIIKAEQRRIYESAHGPTCGCDDCEEERNR